MGIQTDFHPFPFDARCKTKIRDILILQKQSVQAEVLGELKFFKIKGGRKSRRKEEFLKFSLGGIAGDETSNRKQNFRMNIKMFSQVT